MRELQFAKGLEQIPRGARGLLVLFELGDEDFLLLKLILADLHDSFGPPQAFFERFPVHRVPAF
jgi:hypothetical protein